MSTRKKFNGLVVFVLTLLMICAAPATARANDFGTWVSQQLQQLGADKRWAAVDVHVVDVSAQGINATAISGSIHTALVLNSSYGWPGKRWKFIVRGTDSSGDALHAMSYLYNYAENVTQALLEAIGVVLVTPQSIAVQLYVIVTPGNDMEFVLIGVYRKAGRKRVPVFRMYSGDFERGADEILRIAKKAQDP